MNKMSNIMVAVILALGAIISMAIIANAIDKNNISNRTVTVRGSATTILDTKQYSFETTIYVKSKDLNKAYDELFEKEQNIKNNISKDIVYEEQSIKAKANFRQNTDKVIDYEVFKTLKFVNRDISKLNKVKEELDLLSLKINNIKVHDIKVEYEDITNGIKNDLLSKAMKDAKEKAYIMVKEKGHDVGDYNKVIQGRFFVEDNKLSVIVTVVCEIN